MQQDWRRDPIWQLLGIIISVIIVLVTQFNEPLLKIVIVGVGVITCVWIYLGNKQIVRFFRHAIVITLLGVLLKLFLLVLCSILFFLILALFLQVNAFWEKLVTGAGCIFVFSVSVTLYHSERPFVANVFKWVGFLTGIVGIVLVIVADNPWVKVALVIVSLFIEIVTFIFSTTEIPITSLLQRSYASHNLDKSESKRTSESL